jgi:hypothetical protein
MDALYSYAADWSSLGATGLAVVQLPVAFGPPVLEVVDVVVFTTLQGCWGWHGCIIPLHGRLVQSLVAQDWRSCQDRQSLIRTSAPN